LGGLGAADSGGGQIEVAAEAEGGAFGGVWVGWGVSHLFPLLMRVEGS